MRKLTLTFLSFFLVVIVMGQWEADVKINDTPGSQTSDNNSWCIAAKDNRIHAVWSGSLTATDAIIYSGSNDLGLTWGNEIVLSAMFTYSESPSVATSGNNVHVVWSQSVSENNSEIFYNHSPDAGSAWAGAVGLTNAVLGSKRPSIAAAGLNVSIVWEDHRDYPPNGNYTELYFKHSGDGGITWSEDIKLTDGPEESPGFPSITIWDETVHIAYCQIPINIGQEVYYLRSDDNGNSWNAPVRLSFNDNESGVCRYPTIGVNSEDVHVFWSDNRDDGYYYEIYSVHSQDGGETWSTNTRLTFNDGDSYGPNTAVSASAIHLTWNEDRDGNWEIYYKNSFDDGLTWSSDVRLTNDASDSWYPSIAVTNQAVNVLWSDKRTGEWNVFYKRDPTGNPVGIGEIEPGFVEVFPNPSHGKFQITNPKHQTNPKEQIQNIEVADLYGKILNPNNNRTLEQLNNSALEIDISNLPSGIYFIRIHLKNQTIVKKIIKL